MEDKVDASNGKLYCGAHKLPDQVCRGKERTFFWRRPGFIVRLLGSSTQRCSDVLLADKVVKVPEMAESISEGTLKQWSKRRSTETSTN